MVNSFKKNLQKKIPDKKIELRKINRTTTYSVDYGELSAKERLKLISNDINNREDLADLSVDELLEMIELSQEDAGKVIMDAREPWFNKD